MRGLRTSRAERRSGSVLLLGLAVGILFLLTMAAAVSTTLTIAKSAKYDLDWTNALAVAEGVTEVAQKRLLTQIANFEEPELSGVVRLGGEDHAYEITAIGDPYKKTDSDGVTSTIQHYEITSTVTSGDGVVTVNRVIDVNMTPMFQFMIFYDDDLEILPGPDMTLGGRVHANGDIYVGAGNTLTVATDSFQSTGSIFRRRKNDGSESGGTVDIKVRESGSYQALLNEYDSEHEEWTTYALDRWNGTVQDGSHGVKEVAAPDIQTIKAFHPDGSKGFYHENAGLVIIDDRAYDTTGNPVDVQGALSEKTMYDAREGKTVTVTEIDMTLLNASGEFPPNGLLYAYRTDAQPDDPNGIRIVNGEEIAGPLSVVSEDPLYIQGDFNTVNKKGAALITDALNLLSNGWTDDGGTMQPAVETTYNMAAITGNVRTPDGGGQYSGGFENLPRFHEDWRGVSAHINGSFANMYQSEIARSPWGMSGVYSPPKRDWHYDPDLNDPNNLPPFTPNAVSVKRPLWDDGLSLPFAGN